MSEVGAVASEPIAQVGAVEGPPGRPTGSLIEQSTPPEQPPNV